MKEISGTSDLYTKNIRMNWNIITSNDQLDLIEQESSKTPVVIFKHSTRCSISSMAMNRFERAWDENNGIKAYYLDLILYRDIYDAIAEKFGVVHQSPQVIVLKDGQVIYNDSHMGISVNDIQSAAL